VAATLRPAGDDLVPVAADRRLLRAAALEGVGVFNPENDEPARLAALIAAP